MKLHLDKLLRIDNPDVVTDHARFYRHVPKIAPYAYLHTIFNPAPPAILKSVATQIDIPEAWLHFLEIQNGAFLFFDALRLNGAVDPHRLRSRMDYYTQVPYSLIKTNSNSVMKLFPDWLKIGDYGFDRSIILINRHNEQIQVVDNQGSNMLAAWPNLESFLTSEVKRIGILYSPSGECLVDSKFTVPNSETAVNVKTTGSESCAACPRLLFDLGFLQG
jgi:hypothetical protein